MLKRTRRPFSPSPKAHLLRKHLVDKVPSCGLCNQSWLRPCVRYSWQHPMRGGSRVAGHYWIAACCLPLKCKIITEFCFIDSYLHSI